MERPQRASSIVPSTPKVVVDPTALDAVTLSAVPPAFQLDGAIGEWAEFEHALDETRASPGTALPPASHLGLALDARGLVMLLDTPDTLEQPVWVLVALDSYRNPPNIGFWERSGGIGPVSCPEGEEKDAIHPDLTADECKRMVDNYEHFEAEYRDHFYRLYRVTKDEVEVASLASPLRAVTGGRVASQTRGGRRSFEVLVPLAELPMTFAAPIEYIHVFATTAPSPEPPSIEALLSESDSLPIGPVYFHPWAEYRAMAMGANRLIIGCPVWYQPGEPFKLGRACYAEDDSWMRGGDEWDVSFWSPDLMQKIGAIGAFELHHVFGAGIVLLGKDRPASVLPESEGDPLYNYGEVPVTGDIMCMEKRGRGLHVVSFKSEVYTDSWTSFGQWTVAEIGLDGTIKVLAEESESALHELTESHDSKCKKLGIRAHHDAREGLAKTDILRETVLRYDEQKNSYVKTVTDRPAKP
ncbi:MAG: hypothetical protein U0271_46110 [Polyangiaceae bacterium]